MKQKNLFLILGLIAFSIPAIASIPIESVASSSEANFLGDLLESYKAAMDNETLVAALLCFFLGSLGLHWFYLGETKKGWNRLKLLGLGFVLTLVGVLAGVAAISLVGSLVYLVLWVQTILDLINILTGKA